MLARALSASGGFVECQPDRKEELAVRIATTFERHRVGQVRPDIVERLDGFLEGHAALYGSADELNHGCTIRGLSVAASHGHASEADFGNFEALIPNLALLHCRDSFL